MLHFIYTYSETERPKRNGHTHKTVRIYRLVSGMPRLVAEGTDIYVGEFQLVMETREANKCLPKRAFERTASGGMKHCYPATLEDAGIASIYRVT